jgi:cytochrome c
MAVLTAIRRRGAWCLAAAALAVTACEPVAPPGAGWDGGPRQSDVRAAGFDPGPVKTAAEYLAEPEFAGASFERGRLLALACAACHRFKAEEGTLIGPHLEGVFGRRAASVEGFDYSPALRESGLVWTPRSLEAWLANPARFVEGTTMAFAGYASPDDRRDLIAWLLRETQ